MRKTQLPIIYSRVTQDRRHVSSMTALLSCEFTFEQTIHKAVIVDISLRGAFLSSKILPPKGSLIKISLQSTALAKPLTLDGEVLRGETGWTEHGRAGRFAIRFLRPDTELIGLIKALSTTHSLSMR